MRFLKKLVKDKNLPGYTNRARRVSSFIHPWLNKGDKVLDFGCGNLLIGKTLKNRIDVDVVGVDVIDVNKTDLPFTVYDGEVIPFEENSFDVTYAAFIFHHTTNITALLSECTRVTKRSLLVLEDVYSNKFELQVTKFLDQVNLLTSSDMNIPMNFKKEVEWVSIFNRHDLKLVESHNIRPTAIRPTRHHLFVIDLH